MGYANAFAGQQCCPARLDLGACGDQVCRKLLLILGRYVVALLILVPPTESTAALSPAQGTRNRIRAHGQDATRTFGS